MNNDGSNRPSLVAASARGTPASGSSGRILADMENRAPSSGEAATGSRAHRLRWLLLAGAVLVIVLVLVSTTRLFAPGNADPWRDGGGQTVGQSAPAVQEAAPETAARPALIIDAPVDRPDATARENPLARIQSQPDATSADDARPANDQRPSTAAPAAAASPARRAAPPRARATAARSETAESNNSLLSTLLGIIHPDESGAEMHGSMDSLVAHILAENERTQVETSAALAALGQPQPAQAEAAAPTRAQRELQSCPAANTLQGINCRDRICARWAGRDPACPAR
ncbi:MAG: hypothetical protein ACTH0Y_00025 [Luteimonas sp.]